MTFDLSAIEAQAEVIDDIDELEDIENSPAPTRRGYTRCKTLPRRKRGDWDELLERAAEIVNSYSTRVNLRQLHYRLVSAPDIAYENLPTEVTQLSHRTAKARREGRFPQLADPTRSIDRPQSWDSVDDAKEWLAYRYHRDRTEGQPYSLYLVIEKAALREQLWSWFSKYGIPIVALRGYASQGHIDEILEDVATQVAEDVRDKDESRPAIALYAGDYDPSGKISSVTFLRVLTALTILSELPSPVSR